MIEVAPGVGIGEHELTFTFTRSPGPGGQNTNKVNTRVTLRFDVDGSPSLTSGQRARIRKSLATRINRDGVLQIVSSKERTQLGNRRAVVQRFVELLGEALKPAKPRKKTRPPASAKRKRRADKAHHSTLKRTRRAADSEDD